jgi:hypothetical protein
MEPPSGVNFTAFVGAQAFDLGGVSEAVENNACALRGQRLRDAKADAGGRSGDECGLADEHVRSPVAVPQD